MRAKVRAEKKSTKNVLLWLQISAVSCESNSIPELKLDVNVWGIVQYIETEAPEL